MRAIVAVCLLAGLAHAEDKADALFRQGKKLLADKRYSEACKAFEDSFELEPGIGAQLNIAHCYEEWGRLATALELYRKAQKLAADKKDKRMPQILERIEAVEPQVPRLTVHVRGDDGAELFVDGKPAKAETEMLVDPGPHVIEVRRGSDKRTKTVPLEAGGSSEVKLDAPPRQAETVVVAAKPDRTRKLAGIGLGAGGGVAMVISGIVTLRARSHYKDALNADCMGSPTMCDDAGLAATHDARHQANIATFVFVGGAALAAAGVVLYVTAPKSAAAKEHALRIVPTGTGLAVTGGF